MMNCREAKEILDRMIFEDVPENADLREHVNTCTSCSQVYMDTLKAREIMNVLRRSEPILRNPEALTGNIMAGISNSPRTTTVIPLFLQRLLAAASVAIFLLFGCEQYMVVAKVRALEIQFSSTRTDTRYPEPLRFASAFDLHKAGISFSEIGKILQAEKGATPSSISFITQRLNKRNFK